MGIVFTVDALTKIVNLIGADLGWHLPRIKWGILLYLEIELNTWDVSVPRKDRKKHNYIQINLTQKGLMITICYLGFPRRPTWMSTQCPGAGITSPPQSMTTMSAPARRTTPPPARETVVALWHARSAPHGSLSGPHRGRDLVAHHRSPVSTPVCPTSGTGSVRCQESRGMCEQETETETKLKLKLKELMNETREGIKMKLKKKKKINILSNFIHNFAYLITLAQGKTNNEWGASCWFTCMVCENRLQMSASVNTF